MRIMAIWGGRFKLNDTSITKQDYTPYHIKTNNNNIKPRNNLSSPMPLKNLEDDSEGKMHCPLACPCKQSAYFDDISPTMSSNSNFPGDLRNLTENPDCYAVLPRPAALTTGWGKLQFITLYQQDYKAKNNLSVNYFGLQINKRRAKSPPRWETSYSAFCKNIPPPITRGY